MIGVNRLMLLEIKGIEKSYGDKKALKQLDIQLSKGIYGLLGPNGAGKSTLMKLICMLIKPTKGKILYDSVDIRKNKKDFLKKVGYMPQQHCLYPEFKVEEYLYYIGALKGMSKNATKESAEKLLKSLKLWDIRGQRIRTLSGGMKQRLMFAQAMLDNPDIVILDEPTAGLDPKKRIEMRNIIAEYAKDRIILIATHVVSDVELISDQILLLDQGELLAQNSVEELNKQLKGKVVEVEADNRIEILKDNYMISSMYKKEGKIYAKLLLRDDDELPSGSSPVYPNLEDVYLHYFGRE